MRALIKLYSNSHTGKLEWRCKYCPKRYTCSGGTKIIVLHLLSHGITSDTPRQTLQRQRQRLISEAFDTAQANPQKRKRLTTTQPSDLEEECSSVDPDVMEVLFTNLVAAANLPFTFVKCKEFRALITYLNTIGGECLPESSGTISKWIKRQYEIGFQKTKSQLSRFLSCVNIMCDMWVSTNHLSVLGFIAQGVNSDGKLIDLVLGMVEVKGSHTGENLSSYVHQIIVDFGKRVFHHFHHF